MGLSGASGSDSGPPITRLYGFAMRGAARQLHHLWDQPLEHAVCSCGGVATALLAAEWGGESPGACS